MKRSKTNKLLLAITLLVIVAFGVYRFQRNELKERVEGEVKVEQGNDLHCSTSTSITNTISQPTPPPPPQPSTSTPPPPATTSRGTSVYTIVDSKDKVHTAFKESADIRIVGLVGRAKAIVEVSEKGKAELEANPRLTFEGVPGKTFKDVKLRAGELTVVPLRTEDLELIERVVKAHGGEVKGRCGVMENPDLRIVATDETIEALMALPEARWIENYEMPVFFNYDAARKMKVNECWPSEAGDDCGTVGLNLTGAGQLLTTCDSGIDTGNMETMHPDIKPNLAGFAQTYPGETKAYDKNKHGTHTAGSIIGTGAMSEGRYKGMAYEAKLWAWFGGWYTGSGILPRDELNYNFRPTNQKSYNDYCASNGIVANIFSGSYGGGQTASYTGTSRSADDYCWRNPDFLPCFAVGNYFSAGGLSDFGSAKNVLAVGASEGDKVAGYGSKGPTKDNRIKPDIVAPGSVTSCNTVGGDTPTQLTENYYRAEAGTSMSTPLTAGVCALVREWLIKNKGFNEVNRKPSSALIKAILMGGAIDLGADKTQQGAGRVNLRSSIAPENKSVYIKDYIPFQENLSITFTFTTMLPSTFDAQLVWVDYPGTVNEDKTTPMLVNDLDLKLVKVNGDTETNVAYGNGGDEPDRLNNAEAIHETSLAAGTYKVVVDSYSIPYDSSTGGAAALYMKGAFNANNVKVHSPIQPFRIIVR